MLHLALHHGQEAITNAQNGEVIIFLFVVLLGPLQYSLHSFGISEILVWIVYQVRGVTWNINAVDLIKLFDQIVVILFKVDWDNSGSSAFQKLNVRILDERFLVEKFTPGLALRPGRIYGVPDPIVLVLPLGRLLGNRLREDSDDGSVRFGANVVASSEHGGRGHNDVLALRVFRVGGAI